MFAVTDPDTGIVFGSYYTEEVANKQRERWQQHPEFYARNGWTVAMIARLVVQETPNA